MSLRGRSTTESEQNLDSVLSRIEYEVGAGKPVPIVGAVKGWMLYILTRAVKPRWVLELGTAVGYSTLLIAKGMNLEGHITTVERNPTLAEEARKNLREARVEEMVEIVVDDATNALRGMSSVFDMVFLDIEKRYYLTVLEMCVELLRSGGVLLADNVLWDEVRDFREAILNHRCLESAIIPIEDGLSLSIRA